MPHEETALAGSSEFNKKALSVRNNIQELKDLIKSLHERLNATAADLQQASWRIGQNDGNAFVADNQDNGHALEDGSLGQVDESQKNWNFVAKIRWPSGAPASVGVVGSFNDWNREAPISLKKQGDSFVTAVEVPGPGKYFYKFVVDGQWVHDEQKPAEPDGFGGYNNVLDVDGE